MPHPSPNDRKTWDTVPKESAPSRISASSAFTPYTPLNRTPSDRISEITRASKDVARSALINAGGDENLAIIQILSDQPQTKNPNTTYSVSTNTFDENYRDHIDSSSSSADSEQQVQELANFAGVPAAAARVYLEECMGDIDKAKLFLLNEIISPESTSSQTANSVLLNDRPQNCPICFDEIKPTTSVTLRNCSHSFCLNSCIKSCIKAQIENGNASNIVCPLPKDECGMTISQQDIKYVLGPEGYSKFGRSALDSAATRDPTLHYCPTPDCPYIVSWKDGEAPPACTCPVCEKSFCLKCGAHPYHYGMTCSQNEERDIYTKGSEKNTDILKGGQSTSKESESDRLTRQYLRRSKVRICASCGALVMKESGCSKMKCRCGYKFCYECGRENSACGHTPLNHGYVDNVTGMGDFSHLDM